MISEQQASDHGANQANYTKYMNTNTQHDTPNADTVKAIQEVEALKNTDDKRVYDSFSEITKELHTEDK